MWRWHLWNIWCVYVGVVAQQCGPRVPRGVTHCPWDVCSICYSNKGTMANFSLTCMGVGGSQSGAHNQCQALCAPRGTDGHTVLTAGPCVELWTQRQQPARTVLCTFGFYSEGLDKHWHVYLRPKCLQKKAQFKVYFVKFYFEFSSKHFFIPFIVQPRLFRWGRGASDTSAPAQLRALILRRETIWFNRSHKNLFRNNPANPVTFDFALCIGAFFFIC